MPIRLWFPLGIVLLWLLMALFGPLMGLQPNQIELSKILLSHDSAAWLGYDDLGRPLWDRLVMGAQTSFMVAVGVVTISLLFGTLVGAVSGYLGGWFDHLVTRIIDIFLAFPGILLAIAMAGILGPGVENVVIALAVVGWVGFARLSRAQVLAIKHRDHVQAAIALGVSPVLIIVRHLIPLIMAPLIIEATFGVASVVIAEAGLSFLGLGVQAPEASWGSMIRDGTRYLLVAPHMILVPGVALMLVVLAANLLGDQLRDRLDVRLQNSR
ncbi:MAG: ABC transporter permease [Gammaproteobacteria bacterium]|nr:ABC transporter permease [Gammaproteobacteria bacterium]MCF6229422.1 ABC transporter permease [Gammaproteobacteria bacterium]